MTIHHFFTFLHDKTKKEPWNKKAQFGGWHKEVDLDDVSDYFWDKRINLRRQASYVATVANAKIKQLDLLNYKDDSFVLSIDINKHDYAGVSKELIQSGFIVPDVVDSYLHNYRIAIPNLAYLHKLLDTLVLVDPNVKNVAPDVIAADRKYIVEQNTIPEWNKNGNITKPLDYGCDTPLVSIENYHSANINSLIHKIDLLHYNGGTIKLAITSDKDIWVKDLINAKLKKLNMFDHSGLSKFTSTNFIEIKNLDQLTQLLNELTKLEPSVKYLHDPLTKSFNWLTNESKKDHREDQTERYENRAHGMCIMRW